MGTRNVSDVKSDLNAYLRSLISVPFDSTYMIFISLPLEPWIYTVSQKWHWYITL